MRHHLERVAAAMDSLKRIGLISGSGPTLEFADHWIELLRPEYQTLLREALSRHLLPPNRLCYAVCLSERADQLSQWRAYGDDGRGVALGFDLSTFAQREPSFTVCSDDGHPLETHMMTLYRPIVYGRERSTECFDELAARMARNVHDLRAASTRTQDAVRARLLDATLEFIAATAFCKKRFFREEREWRLAIWGPNANTAGFETLQEGLAHALPRRFPDTVTHARFTVLPRTDRLVPTIDLGLDLGAHIARRHDRATVHGERTGHPDAARLGWRRSRRCGPFTRHLPVRRNAVAFRQSERDGIVCAEP